MLSAAAVSLGAAACDREDPQLDPFAVVLGEVEGLDSRAPAEALEGVRRGRAARDLPSLASHEARLVLELEGLPAALAVLDEAVERFPRSAGLRWDRAALRARAGQLDAAAADLRGPVGRGELDPAELGRDPDLAALGGSPRHAELVRLPELRLSASARPDGIVGDRWSLELEVQSPPGVLEVVSQGPLPGAELSEVVEDVLNEGDLEVSRRLRWRGRLTGASAGRVGPWEARVGAVSATTQPLPLEVTALGEPGPTGSSWPRALPVPSALRGEAELPGAWRVGAAVVVAAPAHLDLDHPQGCVRLERRLAGRRDWHGVLCAADHPGTWAVRDGDTVLTSGAISDLKP
jgi:hypothetical protein